jgi:DNA-binding IclR family transcriptional regulator
MSKHLAVVSMDAPSSEEADASRLRETGLIGSLQKGLDVFDMFSRDRSIVTVGEIAKHLGLHKSSASRIAATLVALGYLRPAARSSGFQLGGKLARLGSLSVRDTSLTSVAEPFMLELVEKTGETCHLGVLEGAEAVTVGLVEGSFSLRLHSWVGKRSPAHLTAMGKVLLAGLSDRALDLLYPDEELEAPTPYSLSTKAALKSQLAKLKSVGHALDNEELEIGLRCVAAPIYSHDERVVASLTIAGSASRIQHSNIGYYVEQVKATADRISVHMGAPQEATARVG